MNSIMKNSILKNINLCYKFHSQSKTCRDLSITNAFYNQCLSLVSILHTPSTKRLKENPNLSKDEIAKLQQRWMQEGEWMIKLHTPYIVRGLNDQIDPHFLAYLTELHAWRPLKPIVMEYCNEGDVRAKLKQTENINGLVEIEVREILHTLRHAIEFLHTKCCIEHRDLKPENVVIHHTNGRRYYKLTDFGFARNITENTMLKSIVGTRNYVAPEVLDTAKYKNTVDYWSLGVIAYEIICGNLPFIPHQQLFDIVTTIRKKSHKCIAITEDFPEKKYIFHDKIPVENRMSTVFLCRIENWLTIALDQNYQTRGTRVLQTSTERVLTFYTELDAILTQKVLTVFSLTTFTLYAWEVNAKMTLLEFRELIKRDTGITDVFCIFPTGHPRPVLSATYMPIDFFVEDWQHNRDDDSPLVMLYITGPNSEFTAAAPRIPRDIKKHLSTKVEIPNWLLKSIEQSTHYLLSSEQFQLEAFLCGLKEYALTMEHDIFQYDANSADDKRSRLQEYLHALTDMNGRIDQFCMNINAAKQIVLYTAKNRQQCESFFGEWIIKAENLKKDFVSIDSLKAKVIRYYKSGLRRAKQMVLDATCEELKNKDAYKLIEFRHHLESAQKLRKNYKQRLEACRNAVYDCLGQREKLMTNGNLKYMFSTITSVHLEFGVLRRIVDNTIKRLNEMRNTLAHITTEFHTKIIEFYKCGVGSCNNNFLQDGVSPILINSDTNNSIRELLQCPVNTLIGEVKEMIAKMEICEDLSLKNDLPATINQ